jgi:hypothetical protein
MISRNNTKNTRIATNDKRMATNDKHLEPQKRKQNNTKMNNATLNNMKKKTKQHENKYTLMATNLLTPRTRASTVRGALYPIVVQGE